MLGVKAGGAFTPNVWATLSLKTGHKLNGNLGAHIIKILNRKNHKNIRRIALILMLDVLGISLISLLKFFVNQFYNGPSTVL